MDALASLLQGPRARDPFLLRCVMTPPWSLRISDQAPLTVVAVVRGEAWLVPDSKPPLRMPAGHVAVVRGPDPYTLAGDPSTAPQILVGPDQRCATLRGEPLHETMNLGVRTWGNDPEGSTTVLVGVYQARSEVGASLLHALPTILTLRPDAQHRPLVSVLEAEIANNELGQQVVLNRLLDLLVVSLLRTWFSRPEASPPGWYRAQSDQIVGRALRLLQNDPACNWTVASLASACGISRAALARRFTQLVGQPPMTYLTELRLATAADLLLDPNAKIAAVAQQVGYSSPFALSAAFSRVRGTSPSDYRLTATG